MNRGKQQMSKRDQKKMNKAVRDGQTASFATLEPAPLNTETTPEEILKKFPKKSARKIKAEIAGTLKGMENKKKKLKAKHSRRASPGDVPRDSDYSPPKVVEVEGKRWIKTITKQIQLKTKLARRRDTKTKTKKSSWKRFFFGL